MDIYFLFYVQVWVLLSSRVCTHIRGRNHSISSLVGQLLVGNGKRACGTRWALTSGEIYRSLRPAHLNENFFRLRCRSVAVAAGVPACWSWLLGLRAKQVNMCSEEALLLLQVCVWLLVHCLYPTQCREALCKAAWIRNWFCPPTGTDLKSMCMQASLRVLGGNEIQWYILMFFLLQWRLLQISIQCTANVHSITPTFCVMHNKMFKWHTSTIEL